MSSNVGNLIRQFENANAPPLPSRKGIRKGRRKSRRTKKTPPPLPPRPDHEHTLPPRKPPPTRNPRRVSSEEAQNRLEQLMVLRRYNKPLDTIHLMSAQQPQPSPGYISKALRNAVPVAKPYYNPLQRVGEGQKKEFDKTRYGIGVIPAAMPPGWMPSTAMSSKHPPDVTFGGRRKTRRKSKRKKRKTRKRKNKRKSRRRKVRKNKRKSRRRRR